MENSIDYLNKQNGYFTAARHDMVSLLPQNPTARLLELGAGGGDTLLAAKQAGKAGELHGVDLVRLPGTLQEDPRITRFTVADIEAEELDYPSEFFDIVICADVLEHLRNPWTVVRQLTGLLVPGGLIVASIPNIRHYFALMPILRGDFRYEEAGVLDHTHLRFFARRNIKPLFTQAGLEIARIEANRMPYGLRQKVANWMTLGLLSDCFVLQFRIVARKPS